MKKCRRCSKPATLHITEIREGKAVALHLCETCARDYLDSSESDSPSAASADIASKLEALATEGSEESLDGLACPHCGITFAEFRETGRFGCPADYAEFMEHILPLLENIHEDTTHVGKQPRRHQAGSADFSRLIQLRKELQDAVDCENYESAASLRDQITALEAEARAPLKDDDLGPPPRKPSLGRRRSTPKPPDDE